MKPRSEDLELVEKEYGRVGDARQIQESDEARAAGLVYLMEGIHSFELANGAP